MSSTVRDTPTAAAPTPPRVDALDGLRGLAAFGVVVLHVWMFSYGDLHHPPKTFLDLVAGELRLGVQLFFVLSGYLVFRPFAAAALDGRRAPRLARYALRRAARILPAYWVALAGCFLLLRHLGHPMQVGVGELPTFLLFAQNQFDTTIKHLDPPMWTLAIEVSFYVLAPFAGALALRLGARRGRQALMCIILVTAGLLFVALSAERRWPETLSTSLPAHLVEFGAGMTVAVLLHRRTLSRRTVAVCAVVGAALVVVNSTWHALTVGEQWLRSDVGDAPGIAGLALLIAVVVARPARVRALSAGPARWLGTISYGMYLVHFPVIVGVRMTGHWPQTLEAQLGLVTAITVPLSVALWFGVERPAIRWARRRTTGDRQRSRIATTPWPPAAQTEISARPEPFSARSLAAVATRRPPVAAKGWPAASEEPLTLSRARSIEPRAASSPSR
jgi:peptidoglycan/LPS O-acetylase OafA/YrhL